MKRSMPVGFGSVRYESRASLYPDIIRVMMADGQTIEYRKNIAQPRPHLADQMSFDMPKKHEKKESLTTAIANDMIRDEIKEIIQSRVDICQEHQEIPRR